jgi:hypothetical protein
MRGHQERVANEIGCPDGTELCQDCFDAGFSGYKVQTNRNLLPDRWFNATNPAVVTNGVFQMTLPVSAPTTFYRLIR